MRIVWSFCVLTAFACAGAALPASAADRSVADVGPADEPAPVPVQEIYSLDRVDSGYVILQGRYLPLPYVVESQGSQVFINGHRIEVQRLQRGRSAKPRHPGSAIDGDRADDDRFDQAHDGTMLAERVFTRLEADRLLIAFDEQQAVFMPQDREMDILSVLVSEQSPETKVQSLLELSPGQVAEEQWRRLVGAFQPHHELSSRTLPPAGLSPEVGRSAVAAPRNPSQAVKYLLTIGGMGLAAIAVITVLGNRPAGGSWSELNPSQEAMSFVTRCAGLLVALNVWDLGCTLLAHQAGGFAELNPLGSVLIESPAVLATFKICATLGSAAILLRLRVYRGAQLAAWWLCLLCAVLTVRWVTYSSLFMA